MPPFYPGGKKIAMRNTDAEDRSHFRKHCPRSFVWQEAPKKTAQLLAVRREEMRSEG
jgi:hypothetical protein